jgi:hypothetical protein
MDITEQMAIKAEGMILLARIEIRLIEQGTLLWAVWSEVSEEQGNCYPVAAAVGLAAERAGYKATVVHGRPTLQADPFEPYEHAWVEVETRMGCMAVDMSNGCNAALPVERYYALGKVEADKVIYSPKEVWDLIAENDHYGPFRIPLA